MVGDLTRGVAQAHFLIEGGGAEPAWAAIIKLIPFPEPDMVAFSRATGERLFEGEVLLPAEQKQIAHRRIVVGTAEDGVGGDAYGAGEGDRVGGKPAGGGHGAHDSAFAADEADIDGIAGMAVAGLRQAVGVGEKREATENAHTKSRT